jgi:aspartyl-tRNA(Asn)/glutamyl-tRNA(Gln) amidotransferase subunit A
MQPNETPLTIAETAKLIETRRLSPVELMEDCLRRIELLDGRYNAFICVLKDAALAGARVAEAEIAAGNYRGPMHGIPIGLKDIYETAGIATTGHSKLTADHVPDADATTAAMLTAAGAINVGKLATWEFAIGGPSFDLPWPPARNPWDANMCPGGSSSGTGTAVATGMILGGMGSDTGGSIRFPAARCGIAGIKPTYGRISRAGVMPLAFSLDHAGPMAWNSEDCAIMMQALAGYDPRDPASAKVAVPDYRAALTGDVKGLRIGVLRSFYETESPADDDVVASMEQSIRVLRELGAEVTELPAIPPMRDYLAACTVISRSEAYAIHEATLKATPELYGKFARERMMMGAFFTAADYVQALRRRRELVAAFAGAMTEFDLAILPTIPAAAPEIESGSTHSMLERPIYTQAFNLTGSPAISVCNGFSAAGLPFGLQMVGKPFDEATVLRAGDAFERATAHRSMRPELALVAA